MAFGLSSLRKHLSKHLTLSCNSRHRSLLSLKACTVPRHSLWYLWKTFITRRLRDVTYQAPPQKTGPKKASINIAGFFGLTRSLVGDHGGLFWSHLISPQMIGRRRFLFKFHSNGINLRHWAASLKMLLWCLNTSGCHTHVLLPHDDDFLKCVLDYFWNVFQCVLLDGDRSVQSMLYWECFLCGFPDEGLGVQWSSKSVSRL